MFLFIDAILKKKNYFMNQSLDQESDDDKNVFMFISGRMFLVLIITMYKVLLLPDISVHLSSQAPGLQ